MGVLKSIPYICDTEEQMKDTKKIKLGKLNFYIIDDNYVKYLDRLDKHIA